MSYVVAGENESSESLLRRFNRKVQLERIMSAARRQQHYEKPLSRNKRKAIGKRKETTKALKRQY